MKTIITLILLTLAGTTMAVTIKFEDKVRSINESGEKHLVTFQKHAAIYHVLKGSAQEKSVLPKLQEGMKSKGSLKLAVDPDTKEIMSIAE
jgi:hypothetical protein